MPKPFSVWPGQAGSLFCQTLRRLRHLPVGDPLVVAQARHAPLCLEQAASEKTVMRLLLEPAPRDTAAAIAAAAISVAPDDPERLLLVLPADHRIADAEMFGHAVRAAVPLAHDGYLTTFAVKPTEPATGYGYLRLGSLLGTTAHAVESFVEKPDAVKAASFIEGGDYRWNAGIFLFRAGDVLAAYDRYAPDILRDVDCAREADGTLGERYTNVRRIAFDRAIMEKASRVACVDIGSDWSDVGDYDKLWQTGEQDGDGNLVTGDCRVEASRGCYVHEAGGPPVALLGATGLVVVSTAQGVLVADRARAQEVGRFAGFDRRVGKPWGYFEEIAAGPGFAVKRLVIDPGAALSLQLHRHRTENWTVVSGDGFLRLDGDAFELVAGDTVRIPAGAVHSVENHGNAPLDIVEVQTGAYLSEDDVIRLEDRYGRKTIAQPVA